MVCHLGPPHNYLFTLFYPQRICTDVNICDPEKLQDVNDGASEARHLLGQMLQTYTYHDLDIIIPDVTNDYWSYYFVAWKERSIMWGEEVKAKVLIKDGKSAYCDTCMGMYKF